MYTGRRKAEEYRKNIGSRHIDKGQRADRYIQEEEWQKNTGRTEEANTRTKGRGLTHEYRKKEGRGIQEEQRKQTHE